jgi:hypothetical protein
VPKIDPTGPVPPYLQVDEIIRSQIRTGKLPTGSRITEAEITETYEVARSTARRTLAVLRDEGRSTRFPSAGATSADGTKGASYISQLRSPAAFQEQGSQCRTGHGGLLGCSASCGVRRWTRVHVDVRD